MSGGRLGERSVEVGFLLTVASAPCQLTLVGEDTSGEGGAIVATKTDEHDTEAWHCLLSLDALRLEHGAGCRLSFIKDSETILVSHVACTFGSVALDAWARAGRNLLKGEGSLSG